MKASGFAFIQFFAQDDFVPPMVNCFPLYIWSYQAGSNGNIGFVMRAAIVKVESEHS
jgi:hypothetical protein